MISDIWLLLSTILLIFLLCGLSLIYSGVSRAKNAMMPLVGLFLLMPLVFIIWYSGGSLLIYGANLDLEVSSKLFMLFNCFFACISIYLVWGAVLERMKNKALILFSLLWVIFVYIPVAYHLVGANGFFQALGIIDFAGGFTVHMTSGVSALVLALCVGRRLDYFNLKNKFNQSHIFLGTIFVWVGWIGFNGGSSLILNEMGILAAQNTIAAPIFSLVTWMLIDYLYTPHKVTLINISLAIVSGLVAITPAAGLISFWQTAVLGLLAGFICNFSARLMHKVFKVDDVLDVFSTHAVGGILGAVLAPIFLGLSPIHNIYAIFATLLYSSIFTFVIIKFVSWITPLRVEKEVEEQGLNIEYHAENIVNL